jgi:hypothetical protein
MKRSWEMIIFAVLIWLLTAISRWWYKWVEVHRVWATLWAGIISVLISVLYIYFWKVAFDFSQIQANIRYILIPAISLLLTRPLVIVWFQKWFSVSSFPLVYSLFALLFTLLLWILFYKEIITIKQGVGVLFALVAIVLLK